jgi:uncharacterized protein YceK
MTPRAICVALLSVLPAAGCGTVANLAHVRPEDGGRVPFGGVKRDLAVLQQTDGAPALRAHHTPEAEVYPRQTLAVLCALDLPFSFVGDLLTWPYTTVYSIVNEPVPVPPLTIVDGVSPVPGSAPVLPAPRQMPTPVPPATLPKDAPKADVPKGDNPKADVPKADVPKADAPKSDLPKGGNAPKGDFAPKTLPELPVAPVAPLPPLPRLP